MNNRHLVTQVKMGDNVPSPLKCGTWKQISKLQRRGSFSFPTILQMFLHIHTYLPTLLDTIPDILISEIAKFTHPICFEQLDDPGYQF